MSIQISADETSVEEALKVAQEFAMTEWWPLSDLPHLAFDHYDIMQDAIRLYSRKS